MQTFEDFLKGKKTNSVQEQGMPKLIPTEASPEDSIKLWKHDLHVMETAKQYMQSHEGFGEMDRAISSLTKVTMQRTNPANQGQARSSYFDHE